MGVQEFKDITFEPRQPVLAAGLAESEYSSSWMYVGIVQTTLPDADGQRRITGAAYGMGPANMWQATDETGEPVTNDENNKPLSNWKMLLHLDEDHPELVDHDPDDRNSTRLTTGFVLVQKAGGGFAGWIDTRFKLTM